MDPAAPMPTDGEGGGGSTNSGRPPQFVSKLYGVLETPEFASIVSWAPDGRSFVIHDAHAFARQVLPGVYKHKNYVSFVRQLNKYGFHKVVNSEHASDDADVAEYWHPQFQRGDVSAITSIKRKYKAAPSRGTSAALATMSRPHPSSLNGVDSTVTDAAQSTSPAAAPPDEAAQSEATTTVSTTPGASGAGAAAPGALPADVYAMTRQMQQLMRTQQDMTMYMHTMAANYDVLVRELVACKHHLVEQDRVIGNLLRFLGPSVQPQLTAAGPGGGASAAGPASLAEAVAAQQLMRTSSLQMLSDVFAADARAAGGATGASSTEPSTSSTTSSATSLATYSPEDVASILSSMPSPKFGSTPATSGQAEQTLRSSLGQMEHIAQMSRQNDAPAAKPEAAAAPASAAASASAPAPAAGSSNDLTVHTVGMVRPRPEAEGPGDTRILRNTFVPVWSVPPRVLLVEDDEVCRSLASRLLHVFGCQIEVAHDGQEAVHKMGTGAYDIVLMDIVMPRLDGIAATSRIRQFDSRTPVISMTSNVSAQDIMRYFATGMTDVLPKPFNRESMLRMLERYVRPAQQQSAPPVPMPAPLGHATLSGSFPSAGSLAGDESSTATSSSSSSPMPASGHMPLLLRALHNEVQRASPRLPGSAGSEDDAGAASERRMRNSSSTEFLWAAADAVPSPGALSRWPSRSLSWTSSTWSLHGLLGEGGPLAGQSKRPRPDAGGQ